jgi:hypothetical protein
MELSILHTHQSAMKAREVRRKDHHGSYNTHFITSKPWVSRLLIYGRKATEIAKLQLAVAPSGIPGAEGI